MRGQNRVEHFVNLQERLFLVKLPEGLIGNGIILVASGCGQLVSGNPATGNQTMFVATTPDDQIRLEKGGHKKKATGQGNAKPFLFDSVNLQTEPPIVDTNRDGMPIVTRRQPGASTGSQAIVRNSKDGIPIVTAGQLMLD